MCGHTLEKNHTNASCVGSVLDGATTSRGITRESTELEREKLWW